MQPTTLIRDPGPISGEPVQEGLFPPPAAAACAEMGAGAAAGALGASAEELPLVSAGPAGWLRRGARTLFERCNELLRRSVLALVRALYRLRVRGLEHLPEGGALLCSNHLAYVDPFLIAAACPRPVRFLMYRGMYERPWLRPFARWAGAIPIAPEDNPRTLARELQRAVEHAAAGGVVCIFGEGEISRSGRMQSFRPGLEFIARRAGVPVVPVHLGGVWGSIFSFSGGRVLWKVPRHLPYPVRVDFGRPLPPSADRAEVHGAVAELQARDYESRARLDGNLAEAFVRSARTHRSRTVLVDGTGAVQRTFGDLLVRALALASTLERELDDSERVGVLLPPGEAGVLVNVALALMGRTSVNLNYTMPNEALADPLEQAGVTRVVTARRFLKHLDRPSPLPSGQTLFAEDFAGKVRTGDKLRAWLLSRLPAAWLARRFRRVAAPGSAATIVFSSGSTARPKGVVLSHTNILANVRGVGEVFDFRAQDRLLGILPLFHSFGYTVTLWTPCLLGISVVYHANPLDAKRIGELIGEHKPTVLLATPSFYRTWLRRFRPEQLASVRLVMAGAERLPDALRSAWKKKFATDILEGYGCTELAPVVSFNVPDTLVRGRPQRLQKSGTIGRPLPGVAVRVQHPETGAVCAPGEEGLLWVRGPNLMREYLGQPELTAEVVRDGWYNTGDIGRIDEEGFLVLTDRLARFSKIGGEMVPHGAVEDALARALDELGVEGQGDADVELAVTAVADPQRGERLVVVHTPWAADEAALLEHLQTSDLPKLFLPRAGSFVEAPELPKLGTGKLDLRALRELAVQGLA